MEANEVSQSCDTGAAAENLWELWGEKKNNKKKRNNRQKGEQWEFDNEAPHEPPNREPSTPLNPSSYSCNVNAFI